MEENKFNESLNYSVVLSHQKIIFVGDSGVGKTTIIKRIIEEKFNDLNDSSIGVDYYSKDIKFKGDELKLQIWDTAGQEKYRGLITSYARNAVLAFIIYDISSVETFKSLSKWIDYLNSIEKMKIIICGNKIDLKDRKINQKDGEEFAKNDGLPFFDVSAINNENIEYMFYRSIVELPYFESKYGNKDKDELAKELLKENKNMNMIKSNDYETLNMNKQSYKSNNNEDNKKNNIIKDNKLDIIKNEKNENDNNIQSQKNNSSNTQYNSSTSESKIQLHKNVHGSQNLNRIHCPC